MERELFQWRTGKMNLWRKMMRYAFILYYCCQMYGERAIEIDSHWYIYRKWSSKIFMQTRTSISHERFELNSPLQIFNWFIQDRSHIGVFPSSLLLFCKEEEGIPKREKSRWELGMDYQIGPRNGNWIQIRWMEGSDWIIRWRFRRTRWREIEIELLDWIIEIHCIFWLYDGYTVHFISFTFCSYRLI